MHNPLAFVDRGALSLQPQWALSETSVDDDIGRLAERGAAVRHRTVAHGLPGHRTQVHVRRDGEVVGEVEVVTAHVDIAISRPPGPRVLAVNASRGASREITGTCI